ncbi:MAG: DUF3592 domain-containing protein [Anaerolineaceae bacterium]
MNNRAGDEECQRNTTVQTENDEVISMEVDEVIYTRAEDIPNLKDRKMIQKLMAKNSGGDSEDGLDREFVDEIHEMNRSPKYLAWLLLAVFSGVAAIMFIIAVSSTVGTIRTLSREKSTTGVVVDEVTRPSRDSETGEVTDYIYPLVEYTPAGGSLLRVQLSEGSTSPDYLAGDQVTILYDPDRPRDARIKSAAGNLLMWILPGVTLLVGAGFLTAALVMVRFWPPWRKKMVRVAGF